MSAILKFLRENHILALIEQTVAKKKSRLCLNAFEICDIPELLYTCSEIEHLYLHRNKISLISCEISQLINLTTLTLDYNNLTSLPAELGDLKNLVNLNISYNPLNELIPEIGNLENLEAFWCNKIGLREIPKEIGKLSKLDTFGARGNELQTIPEEMTNLSKLRWLTLENNQIETLPDSLDKMESLIHCNLRHNRLREFPLSMLKCTQMMYLQLNNNQISSLPDEFMVMVSAQLGIIDLHSNPICELTHPEHRLVRYTDDEVEASGSSSPRALSTAALAVNATALRVPALPAVGNLPNMPAPNVPNVPDAGLDPLLMDLDFDNASLDSSEDWENSVNSSELDVQYQSDDERADNEAVGMVLPDLSRYASTAS